MKGKATWWNKRKEKQMECKNDDTNWMTCKGKENQREGKAK